MTGTDLLGEFEQLVLLAILQHRDEGYAILVRGAIEEVTDRPISRGALYRTLDRLEGKGLVTWELESPTMDRGRISSIEIVCSISVCADVARYARVRSL